MEERPKVPIFILEPGRNYLSKLLPSTERFQFSANSKKKTLVKINVSRSYASCYAFNNGVDCGGKNQCYRQVKSYTKFRATSSSIRGEIRLYVFKRTSQFRPKTETDLAEGTPALDAKMMIHGDN